MYKMTSNIFLINTYDQITAIEYAERYKFIEKDVIWSVFKVSEFLENKLKQYKVVQKYGNYHVWQADNVIIKMYDDYDYFENAIYFQTELYKLLPNIICPLLETWDNGYEWFTVSAYGGKSVPVLYDLKMDECSEYHPPDHLVEKINNIVLAIRSVGYKHEDVHAGNFVVDDFGNMKIIDYDDIVKI